MKKRIIEPRETETSPEQDAWLNVEELAQVELQSEDPAHPIEAALIPGKGDGWRADASGPQTIRLLFHEPQALRHIQLCFQEAEIERTQEFVLRWSKGGESGYNDIVRQQWNFSPSGNTTQTEDYRVTLSDVRALELQIIPDISKGGARATLAHWRMA
ncbi:MAG: carbohydrate-binding protein [Kiritimatiellae bacterium]|nr:carbohydrate-binding protein [Kiritimatiellia bacterium]MDD4736148.1 carbohydrate-binding protein [Kiritimatiellia bacterium]